MKKPELPSIGVYFLGFHWHVVSIVCPIIVHEHIEKQAGDGPSRHPAESTKAYPGTWF